MNKLNEITEKIIGCAIEVHKALGAGLLESVYEEALCIEMEIQGLNFERQKPMPLLYKEKRIGDFRLDLLIENEVIVEIKSVERFDPIFSAQILTYLRIAGKRVGLLLNFNSKILKEGIKRFVL